MVDNDHDDFLGDFDDRLLRCCRLGSQPGWPCTQTSIQKLPSKEDSDVNDNLMLMMNMIILCFKMLHVKEWKKCILIAMVVWLPNFQ